MKTKILIIVLTLLSLAGTVFGQNFDMGKYTSVHTKVVCEAGKKFLIVVASNDKANTTNPEMEMKVTQIYKPFNGWANPPVPEECKK